MTRSPEGEGTGQLPGPRSVSLELALDQFDHFQPGQVPLRPGCGVEIDLAVGRPGGRAALGEARPGRVGDQRHVTLATSIR